MQNKTLIVVLTALGILAVAVVAGLTRDQWMGRKTEVAAVAPEAPKPAEQPAATTEAPKPAEQPAATTEAPKPAEQPAATTEAPKPAEQPAVTTEAPKPAEQPAATTEAQKPAAQTAAATTEAQQPAATPEAPKPAEQPAEQPAASTQAPATPAPATTAAQQTAAAQPVTQPATQPEQPAAGAAQQPAVVPTFDTVRIEKSGDAVIAGTAAPGAEVVVLLDGKPIGETAANSDGAFVLVPEAPLAAGSGALTLEAKAPGAAQATPSQQSVAVIVPAADQPRQALVAVVSPDQPTKVLQKPDVIADATAPAATPAAEKPAKLVSIDAVDYDAAGNIVFSGQGNAGNTARVYIDNSFIGDAPVGPDGRWTFSATAEVKPGAHTLRVDGLDSAGKVLNRVEVPFVREEQKKVVDAGQQLDATQSGSSAKTDLEATQQAGQQPASLQPESQQQPSATSAKPKDGRVVIQPGNNLWTIARVLYGSGAKFTTLYEANKNQIRDPNRIYPGQIFTTPNVAPTLESIDPKRRAPLTPEENAASGQ